jgi:hypothetical protein
LGDNKHLFTDIDQRAVHFPVFILEDSQVHDFIGHPTSFLLAVIGVDAKQHHETLRNRSDRLTPYAH